MERLRVIEESLLAPSELLENPEFAIEIFEASPDAIVIVDDTGMVRLVNRQAEFLFGYHRSEMVNHPVEQLIPVEVRDTHIKHRAKYAEEPRIRPMGIGLYVEALRKDGSTLTVEANLSPIVTRSGWFVIATIRRRKQSVGE